MQEYIYLVSPDKQRVSFLKVKGRKRNKDKTIECKSIKSGKVSYVEEKQRQFYESKIVLVFQE